MGNGVRRSDCPMRTLGGGAMPPARLVPVVGLRLAKHNRRRLCTSAPSRRAPKTAIRALTTTTTRTGRVSGGPAQMGRADTPRAPRGAGRAPARRLASCWRNTLTPTRPPHGMDGGPNVRAPGWRRPRPEHPPRPWPPQSPAIGRASPACATQTRWPSPQLQRRGRGRGGDDTDRVRSTVDQSHEGQGERRGGGGVRRHQQRGQCHRSAHGQEVHQRPPPSPPTSKRVHPRPTAAAQRADGRCRSSRPTPRITT